MVFATGLLHQKTIASLHGVFAVLIQRTDKAREDVLHGVFVDGVDGPMETPGVEKTTRVSCTTGVNRGG